MSHSQLPRRASSCASASHCSRWRSASWVHSVSVTGGRGSESAPPCPPRPKVGGEGRVLHGSALDRDGAPRQLRERVLRFSSCERTCEPMPGIQPGLPYGRGLGG